MAHFLLAMVILAAEPAAQTDPAPAEADDVFACDFEDSADQNYDTWPDQWTRRRGRGYPDYLPIEIVADDQANGGSNRCLRVKLDGGAALLYSPEIPVVPQFSYQMKARIRTNGLKYDIVSCSLSFYDGEEKLLESQESTRIRDAAQWTTLDIGPVTPAGDRVRTAIISVHLRPGEQADLVGEFYLDDLWLGRLPKLSVEIGSENGVFRDPQAIRVNCRVSGFKSAKPEIKFELLDVYGTLLAEQRQTMLPEAASGRPHATPSTISPVDSHPGFSGGATWQPPVSRPGFYTVRVSTPSRSGTLMTEEVSFVVLPELIRARSGEFGWSLANEQVPVPIRALPSLLSQFGVHWIKYPVWFHAKDLKRAEEVAWFAERLSTFDIHLVGLLDQPPPEVRALYGSEQIPIAKAFSDKAVWHPAIDPVITRLGLKVRWWQLGRDDDTSFASFPDLGQRLQDIRDELSNFGQRVHVGLPWRAIDEYSVSDTLQRTFLSHFDELPMTDEELKSYAPEENDLRTHWIMLQPLSDREYSLETRTRDLVRRMVAAKIARADAIFVPEPFHPDRGLMRPDGSPGPLLLAWRTTAMFLGGADHIGSILLPQGSENHTFTRENDAVMVVWNDRPGTESIFLGENVKQYDLWGSQVSDSSNNGEEIQVGPMPTFITGLHPALAQWRRDFRFETRRLASVFGREQLATYQFTNTFPQGLGGHIKFHVPDDWKVDGAERQFKLLPGETLRDALRVQLGAESTSGLHKIRVDFDVTAERNYKFSLYETIQVGLGDVVVQFETRLDEHNNLIIDQHLINNTDKNVSFKCYVSAPGRRRERQQVLNLGRGRSTNYYVFPNGQELVGKVIFFRAEEIDGARVLNDQILAAE